MEIPNKNIIQQANGKVNKKKGKSIPVAVGLFGVSLDFEWKM